MATEAEFIQAQIDATQTAILAILAAITAISSGAQTFSLDTGQTRQVVTKADIASLRLSLNSMRNDLRMLGYQLNGGASHYGRGV